RAHRGAQAQDRAVPHPYPQPDPGAAAGLGRRTGRAGLRPARAGGAAGRHPLPAGGRGPVRLPRRRGSGAAGRPVRRAGRARGRAGALAPLAGAGVWTAGYHPPSAPAGAIGVAAALREHRPWTAPPSRQSGAFMSQLSRASVLALSLLLAPGLAAASPAAAANRPAAEASAAAQALRELYTAEWEWRQREYGYEYVEGRWQPGSRLPAVAPRDWERRVAYWEQVLRRLDAIPAAALPPEERINAEVFRAMVEADLNNARWRTWEAPFNSDSFFWAEIVPWAPYRSEAEWRRFIQRLRDVPRYFADQRANMEAGLARGWSVPRASLDGRDRTIEPYTRTG